MFFLYVLIIAIISFIWAFMSIRKEMKSTIDLKKTKSKLLKEKILFKKN